MTANAAARAGKPPREHRSFTLGVVAGTTPGKWVRIWGERMPRVPCRLEPLSAATQREALDRVDAALIRLPIETDGLHVILLYDDLPVVIFPSDSHLAAAEELEPSDLHDQVLICPGDDVLGWRGGTPAAFDPPATTAEAIEVVGSGVGIVVAPMSLARLHHRKHVDYRPFRAGPVSTVALAWRADRSTELVETFVGIVRGRTARSSRT